MSTELILNHYKLEDLIILKEKDITLSRMYPKNFNERDILFAYEAFEEECDFCNYIKSKALEDNFDDYEEVPALIFIQKQKDKLCWIGEGQLGQEATLHSYDLDGYEIVEPGDVRYSKWALVEFTEKGKEVFKNTLSFGGILW